MFVKAHHDVQSLQASTKIIVHNNPYEQTPHLIIYWEETGFIWSKDKVMSKSNERQNIQYTKKLK